MVELWLEAATVIILALVIDLTLSDPPNRFHPLRWIGNLVGAIDRRIVRKGVWHDRIMGAFAYLAVATLTIIIALTITAVLRDQLGVWAWVLATAILFKITFAISSFRKHCGPIRDAIASDDMATARSLTQMIVSRDVSEMGVEHISSCCVETVAENSVDSVMSPAFFMGIGGLAGAWLFRCANLMDAMWGYRKERYANLGTFPARFDDVLGFITSRVSLAFLSVAAVILGMDVKGAVRITMRDSSLTPSPNSGWPMAAAAGALGVTMEKPGVHRIGDGPLPTPEDIERCLRLVELTSILFILLVALPLYVVLGAPVQLAIEDAILGLIGGLI